MLSESVRNINHIIGEVQDRHISLDYYAFEHISPFSYHLLFKPTDQLDITLIPNHSQQRTCDLQLSVPIIEDNAQNIFRDNFSLFFIIFSKTVTIVRQNRYKNILMRIFQDFEIQVEWKKGPNYFKAILPGQSKISACDIHSFEAMMIRQNSLNRKIISEIKTRNAYFYCISKFSEQILPQLMQHPQNQIQECYQQCLQSLNKLYVCLSCNERFGNMGRKFKDISWAALQNQIANKILQNNKNNLSSSPESSLEGAIEEAIVNIFEEEYTNQLQSWPQETLNQKFYSKVAHQVVQSFDLDKKSLYFVNIFVEKLIEDFGMKGPQKKSKKNLKTQYAFNKEVKKIMKKVKMIEKRHMLEKQNLFKIIKDKEQEMYLLRKKCLELQENQNELQTFREQEKKERKENLYLDKKIEQIKKQTLYEIKEHKQEQKKENNICLKQEQDDKKPKISLHKKSFSEKCLIRPPQTPKSVIQNQKMNFIERNKNLQKNLNTSKLNQSKQNINLEKGGPKSRKAHEKVAKNRVGAENLGKANVR